MINCTQIREQIATFLHREIDLDAFEDWIVRHTWNIHRSGDEAAERMTFAVEELLSEYSSDHIGEDQLRKELSGLLERESQLAEQTR